MTIKLAHGAIIDVSHDDIAAILTENFCGSYTAFAGMLVDSVEENEGGGFTLKLSQPHPSGDNKQC